MVTLAGVPAAADYVYSAGAGYVVCASGFGC